MGLESCACQIAPMPGSGASITIHLVMRAGNCAARAQPTIVADDGTEAGTITSGGFGPSVNGPIAMGYVRKDLADDGTKLNLIVRGKTIPATVVPLPFTPHRYIR